MKIITAQQSKAVEEQARERVIQNSSKIYDLVFNYIIHSADYIVKNSKLSGKVNVESFRIIQSGLREIQKVMNLPEIKEFLNLNIPVRDNPSKKS